MSARDLLEEIQQRPLELTAAFVARVYRVLIERFDRNNILTYASAMAVQLLTALVPLALVALLFLGVFGGQSVWSRQVAPRLAGEASGPTYRALNSVAEGLLRHPRPAWIVLGLLIAVWEVSGAVRTVMGGLNGIFEVEESRSFGRRFGVSFALAVAVMACLLSAGALAARGGGWVDAGAAQPLWAIFRWALAVALVWAIVALLLRVAPDREEAAGVVSAGAALIVLAWVGASTVFYWWVTSVADYKTAFGTAVAILTLVGYLYTSSIVFLVGAQVDQLLAEQARDPRNGPLAGLV